MFNGIKPTRLWHYTGIKHFRSMINRRLAAGREWGRINDVRPRRDVLTHVVIILASAFGVAASFGAFNQPKDCTAIMKKIGPKKPAGSKCPVPTDPCPVLPKAKPCAPCPDCASMEAPPEK